MIIYKSTLALPLQVCRNLIGIVVKADNLILCNLYLSLMIQKGLTCFFCHWIVSGVLKIAAVTLFFNFFEIQSQPILFQPSSFHNLFLFILHCLNFLLCFNQSHIFKMGQHWNVYSSWLTFNGGQKLHR